MNQLFEALQTKFDASALALQVNGLWAYQAPQNCPLPLLTYTLVSDTPDYAWGSHPMEEAVLLINIWQADTIDDDTSGLERVSALYELLKTTFDDCVLTIAGYTHLRMARETANLLKSVDGGWQYAVNYRITLQET